MTLNSTTDTNSARKTIVDLLTQALAGAGSSLTEDVARKWVEALVTLYDRDTKTDLIDRRQADLRVRDLHERRDSDAGGSYCNLCSNHGDITWPCATIRALGDTKQ